MRGQQNDSVWKYGAQMNGDNICIIMYSKDYLSILHWSSDTSVPFPGNYHMTEYMEFHQPVHATMISAPTLTRSQIRPKLNEKLLDSRDNIEHSRNNIKLFWNIAICITEISLKFASSFALYLMIWYGNICSTRSSPPRFPCDPRATAAWLFGPDS